MTRIITKMHRLLILRKAKDMGLLNEKSLQEIASAFSVNRSTILRDLRTLEEVREIEPKVLAILEHWKIENEITDLEADIKLHGITLRQAIAALESEAPRRGRAPSVSDIDIMQMMYNRRGRRIATHKQIAAQINRTPGAVGHRLREIRKRLNTKLAKRSTS